MLSSPRSIPTPRKLATSVEESFSLSPEDKNFIPGFLMKKDCISLKTPFYNELKAESIHQNHYLDSDQRVAYKITVKEGLFFDAKGMLLDGPLVYVLFPDYRLYAASVYAKLNHSYISSGLDLKGAGLLYFQRGRLITVSNDSGHYKPTRLEMQDALKWFCEQSKHETLIFEDHSQQRSDMVFNGIQYSHVNLMPGDEHAILTPIETQNLVDSLAALRMKAIPVYSKSDDEELDELIDSLSKSSLETGDDAVYFSSGDTYEDDALQSSASHSIDFNNIFYRRELLILTCLQFARSGKDYSSRFHGVLRHSM